MIETKELLSDFTFVCSDVIKLNIENNLSTYNGDNSLSRNFAIDYDITNVDKADDNLYGTVILHLNMFIHNEQETFMKIMADIKGVFKSSAETETQTFEKMLELNGVTALYGVSRGIITAISSIAFPSEVIRLPMLNINLLIQKKRNQNKG